jgi:hypothetical protein
MTDHHQPEQVTKEKKKFIVPEQVTNEKKFIILERKKLNLQHRLFSTTIV